MTLKPYSHELIDYLYNSGMRFGVTPDSVWFSMHGHFITIIRLSFKTWEIYYMSHTYRFYSKTEMFEWIEDQRRQGK